MPLKIKPTKKKTTKKKRSPLQGKRNGLGRKPLPPGTYYGFVTGFDQARGISRLAIDGNMIIDGNIASKPPRSLKEALIIIERLKDINKRDAESYNKNYAETRREHSKELEAQRLAHTLLERDYSSKITERLLNILEAGSKSETFPRRESR